MSRLIFMGSPDFAVPVLTALADAGHDIAAVYSQPPRVAVPWAAAAKTACSEFNSRNPGQPPESSIRTSGAPSGKCT